MNFRKSGLAICVEKNKTKSKNANLYNANESKGEGGKRWKKIQ